MLFRAEETHIGVYTTLGEAVHPLAKSTLIDNCGAMHIVNDINLLELGIYGLTTGEYVKLGLSSFAISGRGKRVLHKILNSENGA